MTQPSDDGYCEFCEMRDCPCGPVVDCCGPEGCEAREAEESDEAKIEVWIGNCSCNGQDRDCASIDSNWRAE